MALPTDANVDLLFCDAVRQSADGKLDIAGYFPIPRGQARSRHAAAGRDKHDASSLS